MERIPCELRINKICAKCGKSNIVTLAQLGSRPVCSNCHEALEITKSDIASANAMIGYAAATGENVDIG